MKMRMTIALLISILCMGFLNAEELSFYKKETDNWWTVFGGADTEHGASYLLGAREQEGRIIH